MLKSALTQNTHNKNAQNSETNILTENTNVNGSKETEP